MAVPIQGMARIQGELLMTKPDKPPKPQTKAEREVIRKHHEERAAEFRRIRERIVPKGPTT